MTQRTSELIREQRGLTNWTVSRQVDGIDENQRALIAAIRRLEEAGETIIIDGHFVLRRSVNNHQKIRIETFADLEIRGVLLLEAPSTTIADRLRQRGDMTWERSEIEAFSRKELEHAQTVSDKLEAPLVRLHSPSALDVCNALTKLIDRFGSESLTLN